ncbi:MAG: acyl-CoA thioesterase FadM [Dinoroseobacter sp.]|jgi:acyl-CoA thioesterase FadM
MGQRHYIMPIRVFDDLTETVSVLQSVKVKLHMEQSVYNADALFCHSVINLATFGKTSFKLAAMPETLRSAFSQATQ